MSSLNFVSMKTYRFSTKDYYCTVSVSFHHHVWKRKPCMIQILHAAVYLLICCLANRSLDSGLPKTKVDFTCFRYKEPYLNPE